MMNNLQDQDGLLVGELKPRIGVSFFGGFCAGILAGLLVIAGLVTLATSASAAPATPLAAKPTPAGVPASPLVKAPETKRTLQDYVSTALTQSFEELGFRTPLEKAWFEGEVLAEPLNFVANYQTNSEGTDVRVDREKLKNFIRFSPALFTNPQLPVGAGNRVCLVVRPTDGCTLCEAFKAPVQAALMNRLERRGFSIRSNLQVADGTTLQGDKAFEYYVSRMSEGQCDGILYEELAQETAPKAESDDEDESPAAADDNVRMRISALFLMKDFEGRKIKGRAQSVMVVPASVKPEDQVDTARQAQANRLVARQTFELYPSIASQTSGILAKSEERYLRVEGLTSYSDYQRFKQTVSGLSPNLTLEERFISPGMFEFAVSGEAKFQDLARQIERINWETRTLKVVAMGPNQLVVVVR